MTPRSAAAPVAFLARWMLLGAVMLGVVAMHHVAAPDGADMPMAGVSMTAVSVAGVSMTHGVEAAAPAGMDGAMHSMLHLCLAVLLAVAGLLLAVLLMWRAGRPTIARRPGTAGDARPPPWRSGRDLLTASCVLRI
ncbi:DUF6153 family protein [Amycolatopsis saalfeldensis]|uniref:Uncharacterized protein n=1 Tax=Amycolatopsis saalfeldensis TaxID=394193 RepID=A0A1H8YE53_9PSEU|nr:DUF6153 family protein [Amycolatopsis saalfeldensis]SEP50415.1 hypothetical protein SAMN04489732_114132 [Amycolatopsis saalfeldensis]